MVNFLHIKNWSKLGREKTTLEEELDQRPNILLSQFAVFGILGALANAVVDGLNKSFIPVLIDLFLVAILFLIYQLNESRRHALAKYIFLLSMNIILFIYANLVPKEVGIYLIFFPLIGGTYIFLGRSEKYEKVFFTVLPISILFILEATRYQIFGNINLEKGEIYESFFINLSIATIAFSFAVNYLIILNQRNESSILQNRDDFKKLANEIAQKNKILKKANEELDRFVYSTSHDLRSPLMSILGLADLAKSESDPPTKMHYIELIEDRVHKLDSFIKEIIEYSRNERSEIIREEFDLNQLADAIIEDHKFQKLSGKIIFKNEVKPHELIRTDKQRLQVILNNLMSNAIKYHDFEKNKPVIIFKASRSNGKISISVEDNGSGIGKSDHARIFEMFYRGSEKSDGTGLGLYIAQEVAEKLQGEILVNSELGVGSEFVVTLPVN